MSSAKHLILLDLVKALEGIDTADDYNTDIQKVVKGKILSPEKLPSAWRIALAQIRFAGQRNTRLDGHYEAEAEFILLASMSNVNHDTFTMFLDDIEAAISKDPTRNGLASNAYDITDTWVDRMDLVDTEELDEVFDVNSERHKEMEAVIRIMVTYLYIPYHLSGE